MHAATSPTVLAALLLAPAASAQLTVFPFTESAVGVYATDGKTTKLGHKPANKLFTQDRNIIAFVPGVSSGANIHLVLGSRGMRIREYCYVDGLPANAKAAGGTTASTATTSLKQGVHSYKLNVRGTNSSNLIVKMVGTTSGTGKVTVTVDIGADKKIEFTHTANGQLKNVVLPITGGKPNPVRITVDGSATWKAGGSHYDMSVIAWIQNPVKKTCFFSKYGKPCDTVDLMGIDQPASPNLHVLNINVSDAPKSASGILAAGLPGNATQLPGIPCPLQVVPLVFFPLSTNTSGAASISLKTTQKLKLTAAFQAAIADSSNNSTRLTNGLRIDCDDK